MAQTVIFAEQSVQGFAFNSTFGAYHVLMNPAPFSLAEGETYTVIWDGTEYVRTAFAFTSADSSSCVAVGNPVADGGTNNGDPFAVVCDLSNTYLHLFSLETATTHTVAIYQGTADEGDGSGEVYLIRGGTLTAIADAIRAKTGDAAPIPVADMAQRISAITGGGSSADVCYVTFVSHDGTVEYGKKAVAVGDDCANPIARGIFSTPTRESDVQYNYTFYGWATEPNGGADSTALKAVNEDRTLYANFTASVRYYTITYYDSDGVTVLKTESVAYGATPSYVPQKDGYNLSGWIPELAPVTGEASYTAQWVAKPAFTTTTWEEILAICEAGTAADNFAVGDTKDITLTYEDGTTEDITVAISDFGVTTLADGTKNNIGLIMTHALGTTQKMNTAYTSVSYTNASLRTWVQNQFYNALPEVLREAVKPISLLPGWGESYNAICWIPTATQLGVPNTKYPDSMNSSQQPNLPLFDSNSSRIRTLGKNGAATRYWTRSTSSSTGSTYYYATVDATGKNPETSATDGAPYGMSLGVVVGFCI